MAKSRKKSAAAKKRAAMPPSPPPSPAAPLQVEPEPPVKVEPEPPVKVEPMTAVPVNVNNKAIAKKAPRIRGGLNARWCVTYAGGDTEKYESLRELSFDAHRRGLRFNPETLHAFVGRLQRGVVPYASSFSHYTGIKSLARLDKGRPDFNLLGITPKVRKPKVHKPKAPRKTSPDDDATAAAAAAVTAPETVTTASEETADSVDSGEECLA